MQNKTWVSRPAGAPSLYSGYYPGTARGTFAHFSYLARNVEEMMVTVRKNQDQPAEDDP